MATPVQFANGPLPQAPNTTLTASIPASGGGTVTVASAAYLPATGPFLLVVENERIEFASIAGTTLTFAAGGRGQEGTVAAAHASGAAVYQVFSVATLARHIDDRAAKGTVDRATGTADVTLSTIAGTYSDLVVGNTFTPQTGRRYKLTVWMVGNLLISGSGFAVGDTWVVKFQVSVAGGAYADVEPPVYLARSVVAISTRFPIPVFVADYESLSTSTLRFKLAATKSAGAAGVTSEFETDNHLLVEDVGAV